jgi:hypothetical protein
MSFVNTDKSSLHAGDTRCPLLNVKYSMTSAPVVPPPSARVSNSATTVPTKLSCITHALWGVIRYGERDSPPDDVADLLNTRWLQQLTIKTDPLATLVRALPRSHKESPCWRSTFPRPKRYGVCAVESVDHTSTDLQITSNARDTHRPAPFDIFDRPLISAVLFTGNAAFWRTSISTHLLPSVSIFAAADVPISSEERLVITRISEPSSSINTWWAAGSA